MSEGHRKSSPDAENERQEIYDLFYEFEHKETYEAKVANALDKLEVQLQHNHADFSTWEEIEYKCVI